MAKRKHIWKLTKAGITIHNEYELQCVCGKKKAESVFYSSLKKCRDIVKKTIESGEIRSHNNWTEEQWTGNDYCIVINSGACGIFSFRKIYVN